MGQRLDTKMIRHWPCAAHTAKFRCIPRGAVRVSAGGRLLASKLGLDILLSGYFWLIPRPLTVVLKEAVQLVGYVAVSRALLCLLESTINIKRFKFSKQDSEIL